MQVSQKIQEVLDHYCKASSQSCKASGQLVNLSKSSLYFSKNTSSDDRRKIEWNLGIKSTAIFTKYLEIPVLDAGIGSVDCSFIIKRIEAKLSTWENKKLSKASRMILIKANLSCMPLYLMNCFLLPKHVTEKLDKLNRLFLGKSD